MPRAHRYFLPNHVWHSVALARPCTSRHKNIRVQNALAVQALCRTFGRRSASKRATAMSRRRTMRTCCANRPALMRCILSGKTAT